MGFGRVMGCDWVFVLGLWHGGGSGWVYGVVGRGLLMDGCRCWDFFFSP